MNASHAYAAPKPKSYVGIGLVVALHIAGIYALSAGLIRSPVSPPEPITVKPLQDVVEPPPPLDPVKPQQPTFKDVPVIQVPIPDVVIESRPDQPPLITATPMRDEPGPLVARGPATPDGVPPTPTRQTEIRSPGAVCSTMPRPEVPAVNWSGEAVLQVIATVRGGRVVGSEFRVTQGALDGKTKRSLQRSVESALAGYQCQGDAMFQQDFAFHLD